MKIVHSRYYGVHLLISKLKKVVMLKDTKNRVYSNAYITIENINPDCLFPCQYYILKDELDKKIQLQDAFSEIGCDIFELRSYIEFSLANGTSMRTLLPPIIEESIEFDGRVYPLINDGMHRIFLAKLQKRNITVVYIRGSNEPYYAYPLPNGWNDVKIVNEISKNSIKKIHRIQDNKKLYRNFDSVFLNCSKPRGLNSNGQ